MAVHRVHRGLKVKPANDADTKLFTQAQCYRTTDTPCTYKQSITTICRVHTASVVDHDSILCCVEFCVVTHPQMSRKMG